MKPDEQPPTALEKWLKDQGRRDEEARLDGQGRPLRLDSEWAWEMPIAAFMWMEQRLFIPIYVRRDNRIGRKITKDTIYVPEFQVATTKTQLEPGMKKSYPGLPFRALEETCLPVPIQQKWEAATAASKSAEWRQWFNALDQTQQKAHVHSIAKIVRNQFWARLWWDYEECLKRPHTRFVAASASALTIIEREKVRRPMQGVQKLLRQSMIGPQSQPRASEEYGSVDTPLSTPLTAHDMDRLGVRLAPCYFRLPAHASRFAAQIFSGKSHEDAVAEQKANFSSWTQEKRVQRIEGHPDFVVWDYGKTVVHKDDAVPELGPKEKEQPPPTTGTRRYQKMKQRNPRTRRGAVADGGGGAPVLRGG